MRRTWGKELTLLHLLLLLATSVAEVDFSLLPDNQHVFYLEFPLATPGSIDLSQLEFQPVNGSSSNGISIIDVLVFSKPRDSSCDSPSCWALAAGVGGLAPDGQPHWCCSHAEQELGLCEGKKAGLDGRLILNYKTFAGNGKHRMIEIPMGGEGFTEKLRYGKIEYPNFSDQSPHVVLFANCNQEQGRAVSVKGPVFVQSSGHEEVQIPAIQPLSNEPIVLQTNAPANPITNSPLPSDSKEETEAPVPDVQNTSSPIPSKPKEEGVPTNAPEVTTTNPNTDSPLPSEPKEEEVPTNDPDIGTEAESPTSPVSQPKEDEAPINDPNGGAENQNTNTPLPTEPKEEEAPSTIAPDIGASNQSTEANQESKSSMFLLPGVIAGLVACILLWRRKRHHHQNAATKGGSYRTVELTEV